MWVEARQIKPLPPSERNAPSRKSICPPIPIPIPNGDTGELSGAGRLGIFLSHQIQLDTTVDTDDIFHLTDAVRGVDVIDVSRMEELRLIIQPVI